VLRGWNALLSKSGGFTEGNRTIWHAPQINMFAKLNPVTAGREANQFSRPTAMTLETKKVTIGGFQVPLPTGAY
jgi:hypothetical protein